MDHVDGLDLGSFAQAHQQLSIPACVYITTEVLRALAHERDVIHRDVKPRNILIARTGEIKLSDFGMSKIADQSSIDRRCLRHPSGGVSWHGEDRELQS